MNPGNMMHMMEGGYVDPQMNNAPLSFNANKGKPPMPIEGDEGGMGMFTAKLLKIPQNERMDRQHSGDMDNDMGGPMGMSSDGNMGGNMSGMGGGGMMMQGPGSWSMGGSMGGMGPMMGQMMGPGNGDMMNMSNMNMGNMMFMSGMQGGQMGWMGEGGPMQMGPPKEIIRTKSSVLYPPPPNAPMPTTRERPPGCRTIFVGGLPETCTEEMMQEVFHEFGPTTSIRKSKKKNFAHVRFEDEGSVDRSLFLSGYRMKIEDKDDKPNTGRLHVDFAMARDDQYEFECKQRSLMRDMRHRQRIEAERLRPPSPPPIMQFSDYESAALVEQLKSDDDFMKASQVLLTWLDRGDANRRNINSFYSMIQCVNSHIRRLLGEKMSHEEELVKMKDKFKIIFEGILRQFDQIEKIFMSAQKQRNWDHFTKAQRKNVELWLKQAKEIKQNQQEEFLSNRQEDEMEMSDDDMMMSGNMMMSGMSGVGPSSSKKQKRQPEPSRVEYSESLTNQYAEMAGKLHQLNMLRDENDNLKCQIEAYKNEAALAKMENSHSTDGKDKETKSLQMAMQGMQQQLIQARRELVEYKKKADEEKAGLIMEKQMLIVTHTMEREDRQDRKKEEEKSDTEKTEKAGDDTDEAVEIVAPALQKSVADDVISSTGLQITDKEAKLLGLVCCFLHVHPTGASIDYIWSYLHRLGMSCRVSELENLMEKMPVIFKQEVSGVGATIERRWHFTGYTNLAVVDI